MPRRSAASAAPVPQTRSPAGSAQGRDHADVTGVAEAEGLPIATTSRLLHLRGVPEPCFLERLGRQLSELDQRAVGELVAAITLAAYLFVPAAPMNEELMFTAPSTTWLFVRVAGPVDDEPRAGTFREPFGGICRPGSRRSGYPAPAHRRSGAAGRRAAPPPKEFSVRSCVRWRDSVRMLTTVAVCALAMLRNVVASIGRRAAAVHRRHRHICAEEAGGQGHRDAMTMPTATEATTRRIT